MRIPARTLTLCAAIQRLNRARTALEQLSYTKLSSSPSACRARFRSLPPLVVRRLMILGILTTLAVFYGISTVCGNTMAVLYGILALFHEI
jgi:hypothetical protein